MNSLSLNDFDSFDDFQNDVQRFDERNAVGTCSEMCPESEIIERENLFIIHRLESSIDMKDPLIERQRSRKMDRRKMVKSYSRPAAGKDTMRPEYLRPYAVLLKTTKYLLGLLNDKRLDFKHVYDFLFDRLRAVRQDMIVQRISVENTIVLLENMLNFYIYSFYSVQSSDNKISTFDLALHETQTKEILNRLHEAYCIQKALDDNFNVSSSSSNCFLCCIWLYNCSDTSFNHHFYPLWRQFGGIDSVENFIFAMENGNFIRFFNLFRRFDVELQLVATKFAPLVRFRALLTMSKAYNSRQSGVPLKVLFHWLDYASVEDVRLCCLDMKFEIVEETVRFVSIDEDYRTKKEILQQPHWFRCGSLLNLNVSVCSTCH